MKQFKTVFNFELKGMLKNKSMIITTAIICLVAIIITSIPTIMILFDKGDDVPNEEIIDGDSLNSSEFKYAIVYDNKELEALYKDEFGEAKFANEDLLIEAIKNEELESGFVLHDETNYTFISYDRSMFDDDQIQFENQLSQINESKRFADEGIDAEKVYTILNQPIESDSVILGKDASSGLIIGFVVLFIMYMLILLYGTNVATSVAREKDSRTMELLITSTKPRTLILGKVFASGVMGIFQVSAIMLSLALGFFINKMNYPPEIIGLLKGSLTFDTFLVYILFSVSGYILYLFIFASLGSLVSKVEDVSSAVAPITLLFVFAYFAASFAMQMPDSALTRVTSFIPFVSIFTMPIRYMLTSVNIISVVISAVIMIVTTVMLAALSIYIYRFGSLNYGNRIKLKEVIKSFRR